MAYVIAEPCIGVRRVRPRLPRVSDFRAGRPAREVEAFYGDQRELRPRGQIHARRVRQTPSSEIRVTVLSAPGTLCLTQTVAREHTYFIPKTKARPLSIREIPRIIRAPRDYIVSAEL